jgi:hypothetical protein
MMNVSPRSVASAAQVLDKASPDVIARVEQGKMSVSSASKSVQPPKPRPVPTPSTEMNDTGLYVAPADKYFAMQEAKLGAPSDNAGPVPKESELKTLLKSHRATIISWMNQHGDTEIPSIIAAFAATVTVIEKHLEN